MASDVIGRRYAEALLDNVKDPQTLDLVLDELRALSSLRREIPALRAFFSDPSVTEKDRQDLIHRALEGKVQPVLLDFLDLLIHKYRLGHLREITEAFELLVEEKRNQARVNVTTAIALSPDVSDRLKRALDVATGKDCILEKRVDAGILGGAIAVYGDQVFDGSVRTALDTMRKHLMDVAL